VRISAAFVLGHLPDDQRPIVDHFLHPLELELPLLLGSLAKGFHAIAARDPGKP
jgi:hypothetical protein